VSIEFTLPEMHIEIPSIMEDTQPFYDIYEDNELICKKLIRMLLDSPEIKNILNTYFAGEYVRFWNLSLNYSPQRSSERAFGESQLWHWDYNDKKTVHLMLYLKDVDQECGPFTYLSAADSTRIHRHPFWIERYSDSEVEGNLGKQLADSRKQFICGRGACLIADPGVLLHQGARNTRERMVLFASFTSDSPYEYEQNFLNRREKDKFWELIESEINL